MDMSDASQSPLLKSDIVKDICLWRRKRPALAVLSISTAIWVLLQVYQFNFVTIASWLAMSIVAFAFFWGNLLRLLRKEEPNLPRLEVKEEFAIDAANSCRELVEEGIRWMFSVSAEEDWAVFAKTVGGLLLLSYLGSLFDLHTLLFIGVVMGMTVPAIYVKYEDRIKRSGEWVKEKSRRSCDMINEKVIKNMKKKIVKEKKEKKID